MAPKILILLAGVLLGWLLHSWWQSSLSPSPLPESPEGYSGESWEKPLPKIISPPEVKAMPPTAKQIEPSTAGPESAAEPDREGSPAPAELSPTAAPRVAEQSRERRLPPVPPLGNEAQVQDFLNQTRRSNLKKTIETSVPFNGQDEIVQQWNGVYAGEALVNQGEMTLSRQIRLQINTRQSRRNVRGKIIVEMRENNRLMARNNQEGELTIFRKANAAGTSYLLEISELYYTELYYAQAADAFIGNFYQRTKPGNYAYKGVVRLERNE